MLTESDSRMALQAFSHAVEMVRYSMQNAAEHYAEPSVLYRPKLFVDGDQWCALYGDNIQDGVCGFGDSPAEALLDFNAAFGNKLPARKPADC